jgi:hypothetical protein
MREGEEKKTAEKIEPQIGEQEQRVRKIYYSWAKCAASNAKYILCASRARVIIT